MADIALLIAEEYERRTKSSQMKTMAKQDSGLVSLASIMAQKMKIRIGFERSQIDLLGFKPKSEIALEASNCFFSA